MKDRFQFQQPLALLLRQLPDRYLRPVRHHLRDIILCHDKLALLLVFLIFRHCFVILFDQLLLRLAKLCSLRVRLHPDRPLYLEIILLDLCRHFLEAVGHIHVSEPDRRRGLVDQVDRLVGEVPVIDIPV